MMISMTAMRSMLITATILLILIAMKVKMSYIYSHSRVYKMYFK